MFSNFDFDVIERSWVYLFKTGMAFTLELTGLAMVGGILFPLSMFGFAWSGNYNEVHWIVPTIFGVILASSILLVFVAYLNYITDS